MFSELRIILTNGDPARAEMVVHLVPLFNSVTTSYVIGLSIAQWSVESIERVYADAISTNLYLVSDDDQYGGYLYGHTVGLYGDFMCCGAAEGCYQCTVNPSTGAWVGCVVGNLVDNGRSSRCLSTIDDSLRAEEYARIDADPMIYYIRRSIVDQQLALF